MDILGVRIDNFDRAEILNKVSYFLNEEKFRQIATVNPEFILEAQKDEAFRGILNNCDLNIADGIGINFAFWRSGKKLKCRMAGIDLMQEILKVSNEKKLKIFLASNNRGLSTWEETKEAINRIFPDIQIGGADLDRKNPNCRLPITNYQIIFCNFGAPFQEKFLNSLKNENNGKIKLAVGVGGSFDYLTRKVRRAPLFMRKIGLEWLFRLWQQPKRMKRIRNAVLVFPIKILFS